MENTLLSFSPEEKDALIERLLNELQVLRIKLGLSQDDIAALLGISRQTYSSIETRRRKMSWSVYLSLILIFDCNDQTHSIIRKEGIFPQKLVTQNDEHSDRIGISSFVQINDGDIKNVLDEKAIHAIETVIMVEYARCNKLSSEAVIKAFDGKRLSQVTESDIKVKDALDSIKKRG